jgi:hypothetical protein
VAAAPDAPLAHSLLAFTLLQAGQRNEAALVARNALAGATDEESRDYPIRLAEDAERDET